jgi:predicted component of type VI protein secretion system
MNAAREYLVPPGLASDPGAATLVVEKGPGEGSAYPLGAAVSVLGKAQSADIVLDSPYVSRSHTEILFERGVFRIRDLGSTNGTAVNGTQLAEDGHALRHGDAIELGKEVVLRFQESSSTLVFTPEPVETKALDGDETTITTSPHGTVTILFSDIEGSTVMTERLGDQRAQEVLHEHNAIIRGRSPATNGSR